MAKFMYFDFRCEDCDTRFEAFVKPDFRPLCEKCGSEQTTRLISPVRLSNDMESRHDHWVRMNKQKTEQDKKFYETHGVDKKHHSYGS